MKLTLVTPHKKLVTGQEVDQLIVPGDKGELDIRDNHSPLMTTLNTGVLRYKLKGDSTEHKAVITWGYCQVVHNDVTILAETCETKDVIDYDRVKEALKAASDKLKDVASLNVEEIEKYQRKLKRAEARLSIQ